MEFSELLKKFDEIYTTIETLPQKEIKLTNEQKEQVKKDLKYFLENLEENIIYRSDYKSLLIVLKNLQFYHYINENKSIETRTCSQCGKTMTKGYVIENGIKYYCSEECLYKNMTKKEFLELYDNGNGDSYWTEWEN